MARKNTQREPRFKSRLAVHVTGPGVIEMMRYDTCYPATEEDAHKLIRVCGGDGSPDDHLVVFMRSAAADNAPTEGRWRSFGCRVLDVRHPDDPPWTLAELRNLATINGIRLD